MTVRRLSEMERYRKTERQDISSKSRASVSEHPSLRKTDLGLFQSVEEVWFAGHHSDVGGGTVADDCRYSLADISLRWMVKQVIRSQCGILFDHAALRRADIDIGNVVLPGLRQPTVEDLLKKRPPTSESSPAASGPENGDHANGSGVAELWPTDQDVLTDSHDELKSHKAWWMLEMLPMKYAWQEANGKWKAKWGFNLGKGREIRQPEPYFHRSVRERMLVEELDYRPKARWHGDEHYVD